MFSECSAGRLLESLKLNSAALARPMFTNGMAAVPTIRLRRDIGMGIALSGIL